jgi:hypothetical protein
MNKKKFFGKIILYILAVLFPLFITGLMLLITSDGVGMIFGGIIFWVVGVWFGVRLYHFIKENKDMLI